MTPEFKEAMDSYEEFFDEYIAFMERYSKSDNAAAMMMDYMRFMTQYMETIEEMEDIDTETLSEADELYYLEVYSRIMKKLVEAGQAM